MNYCWQLKINGSIIHGIKKRMNWQMVQDQLVYCPSSEKTRRKYNVKRKVTSVYSASTYEGSIGRKNIKNIWTYLFTDGRQIFTRMWVPHYANFVLSPERMMTTYNIVHAETTTHYYAHPRTHAHNWHALLRTETTWPNNPSTTA